MVLTTTLDRHRTDHTEPPVWPLAMFMAQTSRDSRRGAVSALATALTGSMATAMIVFRFFFTATAVSAL